MKNKLILKIKTYNKLSVTNISTATKLIMLDVLKINMIDLYNKNYKVSFINYWKIISKIKSFIKGKPLAYIIGKIIVLDTEIFVNKNVLIPRQETEELIANSIDEINNYIGINNKKIIFDVCTGSLVIASILFKKLTNISKIYANDISNKALKVAKINNKKLTNNKIKIIKSSILDFYLANNIKCNIIICNPPYIAVDDSELIYKKEPKLALFAKNDGLYFYINILKNIKNVCLNKSIVIFEIGYKQKDDIKKLVLQYLPNSNFKFKKDINGKWRFLYIYNNF